MVTSLELEKLIIKNYKEGENGIFRTFQCTTCWKPMKVNGIETTEAYYEPFTDNLGEHIHDENDVMATLICENDHESEVTFHNICPNQHCDWVQSDSDSDIENDLEPPNLSSFDFSNTNRYKEMKDGSFKNFKCSECKENIHRIEDIITTQLRYLPFTDSIGDHHHDCNSKNCIYTCKNKHESYCKLHSLCSNPKCDWVQK